MLTDLRDDQFGLLELLERGVAALAHHPAHGAEQVALAARVGVGPTSSSSSDGRSSRPAPRSTTAERGTRGCAAVASQ